jgi:hypothetical protein
VDADVAGSAFTGFTFGTGLRAGSAERLMKTKNRAKPMMSAAKKPNVVKVESHGGEAWGLSGSAKLKTPALLGSRLGV